MPTIEYKGKKYNFKDKITFVDFMNATQKATLELKKQNIEVESQIYLILELHLDTPRLTFKEMNENIGLALKIFSALKPILEDMNNAFL